MKPEAFFEKRPFFALTVVGAATLVCVLLAWAGSVPARRHFASEPAEPEPARETPEDAAHAAHAPRNTGGPDVYPDERLPLPPDDLPDDGPFVTRERQGYADGDLRLAIPALRLDESVRDGTTKAVLDRGVGLYEISQLPGRGNRNVSVAGHRNGLRGGRVTEILFYHLDELGEGDYLYLYDTEKVFRYVFADAFVVEPDDWKPIFRQGYSCLTLTTCTPIGIADHRLIVRGALDGVFYRGEDFPFSANERG